MLFLIKKHELDILDLPIAFICKKYADYFSIMEQLNLDVASEYLVMAATLAHIKSKELLPRVPQEQDDEDEDEVDPRAELIKRLLEYQKYKRAAEQLGGLGVAGRDVFPRGIPAPKAEGEAPLAEISVFKLIDAFQRIVKRREGNFSLEVDAERVTIQERMSQITEALQLQKRLSFEELFEGYATTYDLVVTFLALLEMAKSKLTRIYQAEPEGPIYLEARVLAIDDAGEGDEPMPDITVDQHEPVDLEKAAAAWSEAEDEDPDFDDDEEPEDDFEDADDHEDEDFEDDDAGPGNGEGFEGDQDAPVRPKPAEGESLDSEAPADQDPSGA